MSGLENAIGLLDPEKVLHAVKSIRIDLLKYGVATFNVFGKEEDMIKATEAIHTDVHQSIRDHVPAKDSHKWPIYNLGQRMSQEMLQASKAGWTPIGGRQFGAPAIPACFHLPTVHELKVRPFLYILVASLFGRKNVRSPYAGNRVGINDPGTGDKELTHFDKNWRIDDPMNGFKLQCLFFLTDGTFKHHCRVYSRKELLEAYPYFLKVPLKCAKTNIKKDEPDPFGFLDPERQVTEYVKRGEMLFFSGDLAHSHTQFKGLYRREVVYIDFCLPADDPLSSLERKSLYSTGQVPRCYPSGDKVSPIPPKFFNFLQKLNAAGSACVDEFTLLNGKTERGWEFHSPKCRPEEVFKKPVVMPYHGTLYTPKSNLEKLLLWGSDTEWDAWLKSEDGVRFWKPYSEVMQLGNLSFRFDFGPTVKCMTHGPAKVSPLMLDGSRPMSCGCYL